MRLAFTCYGHFVTLTGLPERKAGYRYHGSLYGKRGEDRDYSDEAHEKLTPTTLTRGGGVDLVRLQPERRHERFVQRPDAIVHCRLEPERRFGNRFICPTGIDDPLRDASLAQLLDWRAC